jgi:hypothetical protein
MAIILEHPATNTKPNPIHIDPPTQLENVSDLEVVF